MLIRDVLAAAAAPVFAPGLAAQPSAELTGATQIAASVVTMSARR
jgi:hypothetical protein